jgi:multisubunit Na+/H+ antiporter MnhB subunit
MSDQNPYEKLGVSEDASFDEIQDARNCLLEQHSGDSKVLETIEAAYDAILMERLRMRQEGRIKVPERIRFPELRLQSPPPTSSLPDEQSPVWLQRIWDQPTTADVLLPAAWYLGLSAICVFYRAGGDGLLQMVLLVGVVISVYFLNRKEGRFGRSVLLSLMTLILGLVVGSLAASWLPLEPYLRVNQFSAVLTFILMWLVSSFLR